MELYGTLKEMIVNKMTDTSNMSGLLVEHIIVRNLNGIHVIIVSQKREQQHTDPVRGNPNKGA